MGNRLNGKVAVVTGAGRGIGKGIALALAAEGCKVVVNDIGVNLDGTGGGKGPADEAVAEIKKHGGQAVANYDTVATVQGGEAMVKHTLDTFGRLDIVVHCAGILRDRIIWNMTAEEFDAVITTHLKGCYNVCKPASAVFRQQRGGRIIALTSTAGLYGNAGQANYAAAKDGLAGFVRVAARDLGRYGVTVNNVAPMANTRMTASIPPQLVAERPYLRAGDPEDVAPIVVYLCTNEAANINGQIFFANGGMIATFNQPHAAKTVQKNGRWTFEELATVFPTAFGRDLVNPAPAQPPAPPQQAAAPAKQG